MIYLASPYTHADPWVMEERYLRAARVLSQLLATGLWTYSPIVHCHELAKIASLPKDAKFWQDYDFAMIRVCSKLMILRIDGWEQSRGVAAEKAEAERLGIPVEYI